MEIAGLPQPENLDGESLLPLAIGSTNESRNLAFACFTGITLNTSGYILRKAQWKYVVYVGYPAQLFNIESDPQELNDVCAERPYIAR